MQLRPTDLLIAPPNMLDVRFRESVLMLLSTNASSGSVALCLNKPIDLNTADLPEIDDPQEGLAMYHPINWGGPVSSNSIWMLHDDNWVSENTLQVGEGVRVSSDREMLYAIRQGDCPQEFRLFAGFASWVPDQLESELEGRGPWDKNHSWLTVPNPGLDWLFNLPLEELWEQTTELCAQQAVANWL